MPETPSSGPDIRLFAYDPRNQPTEAQKVGFVEAILEQAPLQGAIRSMLLIRYKLDERVFNGWLGGLDDMRDRAGLVRKEPKKPLVAEQTQETSGKAKALFGWDHDKVGKPPERSPRFIRPSAQGSQARASHRKPDASQAPAPRASAPSFPSHSEPSLPESGKTGYSKPAAAINNHGLDAAQESELAGLMATLDLPAFQEGIDRIFSDEQKRKLLRIGTLMKKKGKGIFSKFLGEHRLYPNIVYKFSAQLAAKDAKQARKASSESATSAVGSAPKHGKAKDAQGDPDRKKKTATRESKTEESGITPLTPAEEQELATLQAETVIPKYSAKTRRIFTPEQQSAILRIGELLEKKGKTYLDLFIAEHVLYVQYADMRREAARHGSKPADVITPAAAIQTNGAAEPQSGVVPMKDAAPRPAVIRTIISYLNKDEEAELERLKKELAVEIPEKKEGQYRILGLSTKEKIVRAADLAKKKGHGNVGPLLEALGIRPNSLAGYRKDVRGASAGDKTAARDAGDGTAPMEEAPLAEEIIANGTPSDEGTSAIPESIESQTEGTAADPQEAAPSPSSENHVPPTATDTDEPAQRSRVHETNGHSPSPTPVMSMPRLDIPPRAPVLETPVHSNGSPEASRQSIHLSVRKAAADVMTPTWVHSASRSEPAMPHDLENRNEIAESALKQANLIMRGDARMEEIWQQLRIAAQGDNCVLIRGEPGVGKEPMSRAIHIMHSKGNGKTYWRMNCAGIAASLAESELFGHVKGAFTGADKDHKGAFEMVDNGGTILLDEVGDMPIELQAKLLRALEAREYIPVGSQEIKSLKNVKIVAATNRPLEEMIADGMFRKDLYGRLRSEEIMVPNLEARSKQHRMELIGHFLGLLGKQYDKIPGMTQEAFDFLMSDEIDYQENVRGLRDHLERAFKIASATAGKVVDIDYNHVKTSVPFVAEIEDDWKRPAAGEQDAYFGGALNIGFSEDGSKMDVQFDFEKFDGNGNAMVDAMFKVLCHAMVRHCGNNQSKAAKALNITRGTLRMKLRSANVTQSVDTRISFAIDTDGDIHDSGR